MRRVMLEVRDALIGCVGVATVLADELVRDVDAYGDVMEAEAMRSFCRDKCEPPSILVGEVKPDVGPNWAYRARHKP